jgi:hypothetical protein
MGWAVGENAQGRDVGYGVPSVCDHPDCSAPIDRGLSHVCGGMHDGDEHGCGRYFCDQHMHRGCREDSSGEEEWVNLCERCTAGQSPFKPKPDTPDWLNLKLTDESWQRWREENPDAVAEIRRRAA